MKRTPMTYSKQNYEMLKEKLKAFFREELSQEESIQMFQDLVDTGLAWQMDEDTKVLASAMIDDGSIERPPSGFGGITPPTLYQAMIKRRSMVIQ